MSRKTFFAYAGWLDPPEIIGQVYVDSNQGKEHISFEYDKNWLNRHQDIQLDPDLLPHAGRQYCPPGKTVFGFMSDTSPDRWGRTLIDRREIITARKEGRAVRNLQETDYLLSVHDGGRQGAIRFSYNEDGPFESSSGHLEAPPMVYLRKLEQASLAFEAEKDIYEEKWIRDLIEPGSSLGGARPKANVIDLDGSLWIAKFPSRKDIVDVGAWEMVVHELAKRCGINVPDARVMKLSDYGSTFLVQRYDRAIRNGDEKRIHFASAMTMLGETDGTERHVSYVDISAAIEELCRDPERDLREMWRRMTFGIAVSNTDDHLRNHGFLLRNNKWELSPAYDINPSYDRKFHALYISEENNYNDFELALEAADYFRVSPDDAKAEIQAITEEVQSWEKIASRYGIRREERELMSGAFSETVAYGKSVSVQNSVRETVDGKRESGEKYPDVSKKVPPSDLGEDDREI